MDREFESHVLSAGAQRIHVVTAGSGPLVVLCHGFPESWYSWRHQLRALAAGGYRAAALDMRGYGRSSKPVDAAAYRITELVDDCVAVVRGLGDEQAVIVGHDWGAPVAWTAAWTRPEQYVLPCRPADPYVLLLPPCRSQGPCPLPQHSS